MQSARENTLKKIKDALKDPVSLPFPEVQAIFRGDVFKHSKDELTVLFAENFSAVQGQFIYCQTNEELVQNITDLQRARNWKRIFCREANLIELLQQYEFRGLEFSNFMESEVALTGCEQLIARTGSILMSSAQQSGRTTSVYTPIHLCIARTSQLVFDIEDGLSLIQKNRNEFPSMVTLATGPSRTADIEKTLVVGIHGPKEVFCFVLEDDAI